MSVVYKSEHSVTKCERESDGCIAAASKDDYQTDEQLKKRSTVKGIHQCAKAIAKDYKNKL